VFIELAIKYGAVLRTIRNSFHKAFSSRVPSGKTREKGRFIDEIRICTDCCPALRQGLF